MKTSLISSTRLLPLILSFIIISDIANAQWPNENSKFPCYTIATTLGGTSFLYELNPNTNQWREIGKIDRNNIKALAIDSINNTLYSVDGNKLGTINPITAQFSEIGDIGMGDGQVGTILLNDIYGLTHVPAEQLLYATHRIQSFNPENNTAIANTNDLLFKIDPTTGNIVTGVFDLEDDYAEIEEVTNSTVTIPTIYDVTDIAYDSESDILYVLNGYQIPVNDVITINSLSDGTIEVIKALLFKPSIGIATDFNYDVFVTTIPPPNSGDIYKVNLKASGVNRVGTVDAVLDDVEAIYNFNCLDCVKKKNYVDIINCQNVAIHINKYALLKDSYKAASDIYSNTDIFEPNTTYIAGNSITLSNYFSVPSNVDFTALIESCN